MPYQEIAVYVILGFAIGYLVRKFIWKKKSKKNCGDGNCGCP